VFLLSILLQIDDVFDAYILAHLDLSAVLVVVNLNFFALLVVDRHLLYSQFVVLITSSEPTSILEVVRKTFRVKLLIELLFQRIKLLLFVTEVVFDKLDDRVIVPETQRIAILSQRLWNQSLVAVLNLDDEKLFGGSDLLQNDEKIENALNYPKVYQQTHLCEAVQLGL
jgi:hypothetical protein